MHSIKNVEMLVSVDDADLEAVTGGMTHNRMTFDSGPTMTHNSAPSMTFDSLPSQFHN